MVDYGVIDGDFICFRPCGRYHCCLRNCIDLNYLEDSGLRDVTFIIVQ
jgi:hypothetical protein